MFNLCFSVKSLASDSYLSLKYGCVIWIWNQIEIDFTVDIGHGTKLHGLGLYHNCHHLNPISELLGKST